MSDVLIASLAPASKRSLLQSVATFDRVLSGAEMLAVAAATQNPLDADPEQTGWEEVYGPDQAQPAARLIIANGHTRVRFNPATAAFAVDAFVEERGGWMEEGRVTVLHDDAGAIRQHAQLVSSQVQEWTPDRGVLRFTLTVPVTVAGRTGSSRMDVYVTLQRGWTGPRFEAYASTWVPGAKYGVRIRWTPRLPPAGLAVGTIAVPTFAIYPGAWAHEFNFTSPVAQGWGAYLGNRPQYLAVMRQATKLRNLIDSIAYGGTDRPSTDVAADHGTAVAGYASLHMGFGPRTPSFLASDIRAMGGTATELGDATHGTAVQDTQTTEGATLLRPLAAWSRPGEYRAWVIARVTDTGATGSLRALFAGGAGGQTAIATVTSTAWTLVPLGTFARPEEVTSFQVRAWRSGGTGAVQLARVFLLPTRQAVALDGANDFVELTRFDARSVPELVAR